MTINKLPEFYHIFPEKYFSRFWGLKVPLAPDSYAYVTVATIAAIVCSDDCVL